MDEGAFGTLLRRHREDRGLTQQAAAEVVEVSVSYISQLERGLKRPSDAVLQAMASAYDLSLEELEVLRGHVDEELAALDPVNRHRSRPSGPRRLNVPRPSSAPSSTTPTMQLYELSPGDPPMWVELADVRRGEGGVSILEDAVLHLRGTESRRRVQREPKGRMLVALSGDEELSTEEGAHLVLAHDVGRLPSDAPDWVSYARTDITLHLDPPIICTHTDGAADPLEYPSWAELGVQQEGTPQWIAVLTSVNPEWRPGHGVEDLDLLRRIIERPSAHVVDCTMEGGGIEEAGLAVCYPIPGQETQRPWLVSDVASIARHFGQESIFAWYPAHRLVVPTKDTPGEGWAHGWRRLP